MDNSKTTANIMVKTSYESSCYTGCCTSQIIASREYLANLSRPLINMIVISHFANKTVKNFRLYKFKLKFVNFNDHFEKVDFFV